MLIRNMLAQLQSCLQTVTARLSGQLLQPAYRPISVHSQATRRKHR